MPKMGVDPESTKAPKPVPADWYKLRVKQLKAKMSKSGKGVNYTAYTEVIESKPEFNGSFVPVQMNNGPFQGYAMVDFCHGCGLPMEISEGVATFPGGQGAWVFDAKDPENVEKAQYKGPLIGKVLEAEVVSRTWEGQENNKVKQIRCRIDKCAEKYPDIKHRLDLLGKDSK